MLLNHLYDKIITGPRKGVIETAEKKEAPKKEEKKEKKKK